jgi:hypothetical protein
MKPKSALRDPIQITFTNPQVRTTILHTSLLASLSPSTNLRYPIHTQYVTITQKLSMKNNLIPADDLLTVPAWRERKERKRTRPEQISKYLKI